MITPCQAHQDLLASPLRARNSDERHTSLVGASPRDTGDTTAVYRHSGKNVHLGVGRRTGDDPSIRTQLWTTLWTVSHDALARCRVQHEAPVGTHVRLQEDQLWPRTPAS